MWSAMLVAVHFDMRSPPLAIIALVKGWGQPSLRAHRFTCVPRPMRIPSKSLFSCPCLSFVGVVNLFQRQKGRRCQRHDDLRHLVTDVFQTMRCCAIPENAVACIEEVALAAIVRPHPSLQHQVTFMSSMELCLYPRDAARWQFQQYQLQVA